MSEAGTPLEALETGEIQNVADANLMREIIHDMSASGAEVMDGAAPPRMQPMPPMQPSAPIPPMPSYAMAPPQMNPHYVAVDHDSHDYRPRKKNMWSSLVDNIRDPIFVAILVFVLSLPVLHVYIGKYASWAFAVGGQLSWLGLILKSVLAGLLFGIYKLGSSLFG